MEVFLQQKRFWAPRTCVDDGKQPTILMFFWKDIAQKRNFIYFKQFHSFLRETRTNLFCETSGGSMSKKSFEEALESLEQITRELENGDLSLEKSLKKFDEGIKLAELCNHKLEEAQQKVDLLLKKDGKLVSVPFINSGAAPDEDDA
jgi:exodeoxyribonuclease VII small subunit